MGMIDWLGQWLNNENTKIIYVLMCIMGANIIDFFLGWINAKFNKDVKFSSSKAIYGIARKMVMFMLCVFFIPVSLLVPEPMGIGALYVMFIGYLVSELTSILNHLKLASDDKTTDMFMDFVNRLFNKK
jgi:toxin secretion/phage lysis holin